MLFHRIYKFLMVRHCKSLTDLDCHTVNSGSLSVCPMLGKDGRSLQLLTSASPANFGTYAFTYLLNAMVLICKCFVHNGCTKLHL